MKLKVNFIKVFVCIFMLNIIVQGLNETLPWKVIKCIGANILEYVFTPCALFQNTSAQHLKVLILKIWFVLGVMPWLPLYNLPRINIFLEANSRVLVACHLKICSQISILIFTWKSIKKFLNQSQMMRNITFWIPI